MAVVSRRTSSLPRTQDEDFLTNPPPEYEAGLPAYEPNCVLTPYTTLHVGRISRKLIALDSVEQGRDLQYQIASKGGVRGLLGNPTSFLELKRNGKSICVGRMEFDGSAPFPWYPRANMSVEVGSARTSTVPMESKNFEDWTFTSNDGEREMDLKWALQENPRALVLTDMLSRRCVARFDYSTYGTTAKNGVSIGDLKIYAVAESGLTQEVIICSCNIVLTYWVNMGRHHYNDL